LFVCDAVVAVTGGTIMLLSSLALLLRSAFGPDTILLQCFPIDDLLLISWFAFSRTREDVKARGALETEKRFYIFTCHVEIRVNPCYSPSVAA
jgi:hypothetical protein